MALMVNRLVLNCYVLARALSLMTYHIVLK